MHHFLRTLAAASIAVLGLASCGSGPEAAAGPPASGPFRPTLDSSKLIYVVPVDGMNGAGRLVLADAIAASLRDAGKPAVLAEKVNEMGPTVAGHVVAVEERDSVVWVTALWELKAPYGTAVAEFSHQIVVDRALWQDGAAEAVNLMAYEAAPRVTAMVQDFVSPVAGVPGPPAAEDVPLPDAAAKSASAPQTEPAPAAAPAPGQPEPGPAARETAAAAPAPRKPEVEKRASREPMRPRRKPPTTPPPRKTAAKTETPAPPPAAAEKPKPIGKPRPLTRRGRTPPAAPEPAPAPAPKPKPAPQAAAAKAKPAPKPAPKSKPVLMPVPDEGPDPLVADPPPVKWGRPAFLIKPVEGAPGDGNEALTKAMKAALRKRDLTVTEDPRQAGFVIEGRVKLSAAVNGRQHAKIVWAVNTITGDEVGKAVQENAVRAGSLNGAWGRVAEIVSNAAVVGIQELFGMEEKQSSDALRGPRFSSAPDLPQVPGRALPPPR